MASSNTVSVRVNHLLAVLSKVVMFELVKLASQQISIQICIHDDLAMSQF